MYFFNNKSNTAKSLGDNETPANYRGLIKEVAFPHVHPIFRHYSTLSLHRNLLYRPAARVP
jgi:hypothetical protein